MAHGGGGESGWATPDPVDPNLIWSSASGSGSVGGIVDLRGERRASATSKSGPIRPTASPADLKYRFNWTMPLTISPHDRNTSLRRQPARASDDESRPELGSDQPDLSTNDKSRQQFSGGLTGDNIGVEYAFTVMAIAESRAASGLIWAGTNDGQVQLTRDDGKTWTNVTKNIPNLPPWGTVGNIEPSHSKPRKLRLRRTRGTPAKLRDLVELSKHVGLELGGQLTLSDACSPVTATSWARRFL